MYKKIESNEMIYELVKAYLSKNKEDGEKKMILEKCKTNEKGAQDTCGVIRNVTKILLFFKKRYSEAQLKDISNTRLHIITEAVKRNRDASSLSEHGRILYEHFAIWFLLNQYKYEKETDKYTDRLEYYFFSVIPTFFPGEGDLTVCDMLAQVLNRLDTRFNRLVRLKQLNAPDHILGNEYGMIFKDVFMLLYGNC